MGASFDIGKPFRPRQKCWGLGWEESRFSRYDICTEEALLPSITVIARLNFGLLDLQCFLLGELIPK